MQTHNWKYEKFNYFLICYFKHHHYKLRGEFFVCNYSYFHGHGCEFVSFIKRLTYKIKLIIIEICDRY